MKERVINFGTPNNDNITNVSNKIKTSKYTIWNFIPKNTYEQFRKPANVFFLIVIILNFLPAISASSGQLAFIPLGIIFIITAIKDLTEDIRRHKSDNQLNKSLTKKLENGAFVDVFWEDIRPGDVVKFSRNERIPADAVLLSSSFSDGRCYIETKSIDGETNLKIKISKTETLKYISKEELLKSKFSVRVSEPTPNVNFFEAVLEIENGDVKLPIGIEQFLLRGTVIKSVDEVIGIIVYTGVDTKIIQNMGKVPSKRSHLERKMSYHVLLFFALILSSAIVIATTGTIIRKRAEDNYPVWHDGLYQDSKFFWILNFLSVILLIQFWLPIAIYISLELLKLAQTTFINYDVSMYDSERKEYCQCKTSSLSEDLGQVEYIFSDKTGTLTSNKMIAVNFSIGEDFYGILPSIDQLPLESVESEKSTDISTSRLSFIDIIQKSVDPQMDLKKEEFRLADLKLAKRLSEAVKEDDQQIFHYFLCLTLCNTVFMDSNLTGSKYSSQSPDEVAFVEACQYLGFVFLKREGQIVRLRVFGKEVSYKILVEMSFTADRKKMSTIVAEVNNKGEIDQSKPVHLYTKGADVAIWEILSRDEKDSLKEVISKKISLCSQEGLRTLAIGYKEIPFQEFSGWLTNHYEKASTSLDNRSQRIAEANLLIEKDIRLLGSTAVEDKLQAGVVETISIIREAGIKIWMITGDKLETAVTIGSLCHLYSNEDKIFVLDNDDFEYVENNLEKTLNDMKELDPSVSCVYVISGRSLVHALQPTILESFLKVTDRCLSVVVCRSSPLQKSLVVNAVKNNRGALTLAIGDGANDVNMIQSADIGVGIAGLEGREAALSSDFSMTQFRFLAELLIIHGNRSYKRISKSLLTYYSKATMFIVPTLIFQSYNQFTSQMFYHSTYQLFFNIFYTVFMPITSFIFHKDLSDQTLKLYPEIYKETLTKDNMHISHVIIEVLYAFYIGIVCFFVSLGTFDEGIVSKYGIGGDMYVFGTYVMLQIVVISNIYIGSHCYYWTWRVFMALFFSFFLFFFFTLGSSRFPVGSPFSDNIYMFGPVVFPQGTLWLSLIISTAISFLPFFVRKAFKDLFYPSSIQILREEEMFISQSEDEDREMRKKKWRKLESVEEINSIY